jgi:heme-degrading monooxygenase HmoA
MFARVTTAQGTPEKLDAGADLLREQALAARGQVKGFKGLYLLVDRATGMHRTVSLWETRDDAEAVAAIAAQRHDTIVEAFGITGTPTTEIYEVAVQA